MAHFFSIFQSEKRLTCKTFTWLRWLQNMYKKNYLRSLLIIGADDKSIQGNTNQKANDE